jgi:hypothetical protein
MSIGLDRLSWPEPKYHAGQLVCDSQGAIYRVIDEAWPGEMGWTYYLESTFSQQDGPYHVTERFIAQQVVLPRYLLKQYIGVVHGH